MRNTNLARLAAGAIGVALLAGCASSKSQSGQSDPADTTTGSNAALGAAPLDTYWAQLGVEGDWAGDGSSEREQQLEELISQCMAEKGFDYTPNIYANSAEEGASEQGVPEWGSLEFAEQYGFGLLSWSIEEGSAEDDEFEDPNTSGLSASELEEYYNALWGDQTDLDGLFGDVDGDTHWDEFEEDEFGQFEGYDDDELFGEFDEDDVFEEFEDGGTLDLFDEGEDDYRWEDNGCWGWADHQLGNDDGGVDDLWTDPEFTDLFDALELVDEQARQEGGEIAKIDGEWAACMKTAGYPGATSRGTVQEDLLPELMGYLISEMDPDRSELSQEELTALQQQEIDVATADWKCADQVQYDKRADDAYLRMQEVFVEEHKETLDAMVAKYGKDQD